MPTTSEAVGQDDPWLAAIAAAFNVVGTPAAAQLVA